MSEELKPCPLGEKTRIAMIKFYCTEHGPTNVECVECREADNPWRYPEMGTLPEKGGKWYETTSRWGQVNLHLWAENRWFNRDFEPEEEGVIRAWRDAFKYGPELGLEPAPELEKED